MSTSNLSRRLSQALLAAIFVDAGLAAARDPGPRVAKAAALGLPEPEQAVRFNGVAMVVGGAAMALDVTPRLAAAGLIAALVPTTVAGHAFWEFEGPERDGQLLQFCKNLGLIGGLVLVATAPRS